MKNSIRTLRNQPFLLFIFGLIIATVVQVGLIASPTVLLGVDGEWDWHRHLFPTSLMTAVFQFVPAVLGITVLQFVARLGNNCLFQLPLSNVIEKPRQRQNPSAAVTGMLLVSLVLGSWVWLKTVERCAPAPHRNLKSLWVLYDPSSSGYFYEAAFKIDSTPRFLASYATRIQDDVLHVGTHPPGLFLLSRWAIQLCHTLPVISAQMRDLILLPSDKQAFGTLESSAQLERPLTDSELAALFLISELTYLAAALTVVPMYYTVRGCFDALIAWRIVCLWATLPCLAVFLPKSDVLFTLTSMTATSFGFSALASPHNMSKRLVPAIACGLVLWCGLMLSLAHLPLLVLLGAIFLIRRVRERYYRTNTKRSHTTQVQRITGMQETKHYRRVIMQDLVVFAIIVGTVTFTTLMFSGGTDCNMISVWTMNLKNHAAFYDVHTRTAWKWLLINPLELGMTIGLPLALAATVGLRLAVGRNSNGFDRVWGSRAVNLSMSIVSTVVVLWLSCRNSGEAARLWCFLTPWLVFLPAPLLHAEFRSNGSRNNPTVWHTLLLTQMAVCIWTSGGVSGFSF